MPRGAEESKPANANASALLCSRLSYYNCNAQAVTYGCARCDSYGVAMSFLQQQPSLRAGVKPPDSAAIMPSDISGSVSAVTPPAAWKRDGRGQRPRRQLLATSPQVLRGLRTPTRDHPTVPSSQDLPNGRQAVVSRSCGDTRTGFAQWDFPPEHDPSELTATATCFTAAMGKSDKEEKCSICLAPLQLALASLPQDTHMPSQEDEVTPPNTAGASSSPDYIQGLSGSSTLVQLPCSHIYHRACFADWARHSKEVTTLRLNDLGTCPLCRTVIPLATLQGCHKGCYTYHLRQINIETVFTMTGVYHTILKFSELGHDIYLTEQVPAER